MKRFAIVSILLVVSVLAFPGTASAQWDDYWGDAVNPAIEASRWDIHGGIAFLTGNTKDDTTYLVGFGYQSPLGDIQGEGNKWISITSDLIPINTLTTGDEQLVSTLLNYRSYGNLQGTRVYTQIGAGFRWASNEIPELDISDGFSFGWGIKAGADFDQTLFFQGGFQGGENPGDDGVWSIEIGTRF